MTGVEKSLSSDPNVASPADTPGLYEALRNAKFEPSFWAGLSVKDALRYDYKLFPTCVPSMSVGRGGQGAEDIGADRGHDGVRRSDDGNSLSFGMSSVLCTIEMLARKRGAGLAMELFAHSRNLDILVVMSLTISEKKKLSRELLVYSVDPVRLKALSNFFTGSTGEFLGLQEGPPLPSEEDEVVSGAGSVEQGGGGLAAKRDAGCVAYWVQSNSKPSRKQVAPLISAFYDQLLGVGVDGGEPIVEK
ncbi:unnamed protein product [Choristocarpus tenellus]